MSNLKALKTRIQSVQSTRQITSAMYMVAAAKFRKAQKKWEDASEYQRLCRHTLAALPKDVVSDYDGELLAGNSQASKTLVLLMAADRGLCGGFNAQVFRRMHQLSAELRNNGEAFQILPIGRKAVAFAKSHYPDAIAEQQVDQLQLMRHVDVPQLVALCTQEFINKRISKCVVLYNKYVSPLEQVAKTEQLLPFDVGLIGSETPEESIPFVFPDEALFLDRASLQYLESVVWLAARETFVGEFAARMSAMDNATKNSDEMINTLKLEYNQSRQDRITRELIEIISGAEALQKG